MRPGLARARRALHVLAIALAALTGTFAVARLAQACSGNAPEPTGTETHFPLMYGDRPTVAQLSDLGRRIFMDKAYSASGKQSCASCHDPAKAFGPPNAPCTVAARQVNARQLPQATWELAAAKRRRGANAGYVFSESWIRVLIVLLGDRLLS